MHQVSQHKMQSAPKLRQLVSQCHNQHLQSLTLYQQVQNWKSILLAKNWRQIETLWLISSGVKDSETKYLHADVLPNLKDLNLCGNLVADSGVGKLVCGIAESLCKLDLTNNLITSAGLKLLLQAPLLANLKMLSLAQNSIGSKGARLLSTSQLPSMEYLNLSCCSLNNEGARTLSKTGWANIKKLNLTDNSITQYGCFIQYSVKGLLSMDLEENGQTLTLFSLVGCNAGRSVGLCWGHVGTPKSFFQGVFERRFGGKFGL